MDDQVKGELPERGASLIASMGKAFVQNRAEMQRRQQEAEIEKELAEIRHGDGQSGSSGRRGSGTGGASLSSPSRSSGGRGGVVETLDEAGNLADEYERLLSQAEEQESCDLCKQLIRGVRDQPLSKQETLLPQLREFLEGVEGDASTEQVAQQVRQHDELLELLQSQMGSGAR